MNQDTLPPPNRQPSNRPTNPPLPQPGFIPAPRSVEWMQPIRVPRRRGCSAGCMPILLTGLAIILFAILLIGAYFLAPLRTDFLVLGIDRAPEGTALGRSDTMIIVSITPLRPDVTMLSIPRDLWVAIPGVGENRINTAHFFAEIDQPGSGPAAALGTVNQNFGLNISYFVRLRFDTFQKIVDAVGGVEINLPEDMGGLSAGRHHLDGEQALAFVRDRQGTDDFFRMAQGQTMIRALIQQMLSPLIWPRLPEVAAALFESVDTNIPVWDWPRLGFALLRASLSGIDSYTISREMTTPFTTDGGAQVLLPNWDAITPLVNKLFPR